ncbi:MAG TPA: hypothetical protein VK762_32920 [Polyangiaceae bacterium]|nr:hypothetical protein [Polyangiaceae bacterium]
MKTNSLLFGILVLSTTAFAACAGPSEPGTHGGEPATVDPSTHEVASPPGTTTAGATSGPTQRSLQVLSRHVPLAVSSGKAALLGPLPAEQPLRVTLQLPLRNEAGLIHLLRDM